MCLTYNEISLLCLSKSNPIFIRILCIYKCRWPFTANDLETDNGLVFIDNEQGAEENIWTKER
jgi:hypothetical protein